MRNRFSVGPRFARFVVAALVTGLLGTAVSAQTVADVDALVAKSIESKAVPALGVAVVKDGKVVMAKGYGVADAEAGVAANENTVFQIASVTKQFTATAVLMLVEEGKLSLSDPVGKFLPDVPEKWRGVTVRQLLNQVSGIPNYTAVGKLVSSKTYTKAEVLGLVKDVQPAFAPQADWQYSNTNYFLAGMIIEKVSGKSYEDFMRDRIFKPLGMSSTVVNTSGLKIANAAVGHRNEGGAWKRGNPDDPSQPWAAGAIVTTPTDLAKWAIAQGDAKLLKKTSWDEMWMPAKLADGKSTGYGFGWRSDEVGGILVQGHGGGIGGFNSYIARFPNENLSVIVLANTNTRLADQLTLDIAGIYIPKLAAARAAQRAAAQTAGPIADTDLETTKFLRSAFEKMVTAEISPDLFDANMQKALFPDRIKQLQGLMNQGGVKSFELLKAADKDGVKTRTYRITFGSGFKLTGNFAVDAQGKIAGAGFRPEQ